LKGLYTSIDVSAPRREIGYPNANIRRETAASSDIRKTMKKPTNWATSAGTCCEEAAPNRKGRSCGKAGHIRQSIVQWVCVGASEGAGKLDARDVGRAPAAHRAVENRSGGCQESDRGARNGGNPTSAEANPNSIHLHKGAWVVSRLPTTNIFGDLGQKGRGPDTGVQATLASRTCCPNASLA
jgi:hypothetical protein